MWPDVWFTPVIQNNPGKRRLLRLHKMPQLGRVQLCLQCSLGTARHYCFTVCVHNVFVLFTCSLCLSLSLSAGQFHGGSGTGSGSSWICRSVSPIKATTFTRGGGNVAVSLTHMVTTLIEDVYMWNWASAIQWCDQSPWHNYKFKVKRHVNLSPFSIHSLALFCISLHKHVCI